MQNSDPCNVCGSTDVNLIDGFYYCVECGTQDVNVRHTIVEDRALADGTFTFRVKKRIQQPVKEKVEMSSEWHKWHTYNFVLAGLADRLIELGAKPSFKKKLLWLWTEYMKTYQNKDELGLPNQRENVQGVNEFGKEQNTKKQTFLNKCQQKKVDKNTRIIKKPTIASMLYLALNLDESHIQLSDFYRFIREGYINIDNWRKFVPKDIEYDNVLFNRSDHTIFNTLEYSLSILCCLNIPPRLPNMRKLIDKYVKELCLPKEFKELVFALMYECPCDYLDIDKTALKNLNRFPNYECIAMAYIVVAFKMCFGLDDDYEVRLSEAVDKINEDNCYLKSYKSTFSEVTDRLFSFREWCNYIQLRKMIICKYNLHFAEEYNVDTDDFVSVVQSKGKEPKKRDVSDEIVMNLLDKLELVNVPQVLHKKDFKPTTTPLITYTNLILEHLQDPILKLLLSEDFSKYSLRYACRDLCLSINNNVKNIIIGINETNKYISSKITDADFKCDVDKEIVFVRNCNNKNWLKTLQPTIEHFTENEEINNFEMKCPAVCDFISATASNETNINNNYSTDVIIKDEIENKIESHMLKEEVDNIFDDDFKDLNVEFEEAIDINSNFHENVDVDNNDNINDIVYNNDHSNDSFVSHDSDQESNFNFNPKTFERDQMVREIILAKCKKYAIKIPAEYSPIEPSKRKKIIKDEAGVSKKKRSISTDGPTKKIVNKTSRVKDDVDKLLAAYYENLQHDVLVQISEHVKSVVRNVNVTQDECNMVPNDTMVIEDQDSGQEKENDNNVTNIDAQISENKNIGDNDLEHDGSVQPLGDESEEYNEYDPRFDEKKYNINQLYVKVAPEDEYNYLNEARNDCELTEIVDKVTAKYKKHTANMRPKLREETYDSDDDIPLSVMREEKLEILKQKKNKKKLKSLVNNNGFNEFKYWTRHYHRRSLIWKTFAVSGPFYKELREKFPRSFNFVLTECAQIIYTSPHILYRAVSILEERLL